jgi:predicted RNase H-like nuclease
MRFIGVDFGWQSQPAGLAVVDWEDSALHLRELDRIAEPALAADWIAARTAGRPAGVAVDAPLVIPNATGMREADRLTHVLYGKRHAGCYPANLGRPFAARVLGFSRALAELGFPHGDAVAPGEPARFQIEVYPHAAALELFRLERILRYKKGRVAARKSELERFRGLLLTELPRCDPPLRLAFLPPIPDTGARLKEVEDQLDALLCAYAAAHWWRWGRARNRLLGSRAEGYIVVPNPP